MRVIYDKAIQPGLTPPMLVQSNFSMAIFMDAYFHPPIVHNQMICVWKIKWKA